MSELKPASVFECFSQVNKVPRPSKKEEQMIEFLMNYGNNLGLPTRRDECGNVLISKPATPGMENKPTVILQSHMDMVCEPVSHDFTQPIETYVEGDWMKAKGTTLGADDGIGVAMQMAILADKDVKHGPIECLFTRDEETGLTGAFELQSGFMTGKYLINLDSEDEGQIFVSCAGGCRTKAEFDYEEESTPAGMFFARLKVSGLTGGHSGDDGVEVHGDDLELQTELIGDLLRHVGVEADHVAVGVEGLVGRIVGRHAHAEHTGFAELILPGVFGRGGAAAAGDEAEGHDQSQYQCNNFFHDDVSLS